MQFNTVVSTLSAQVRFLLARVTSLLYLFVINVKLFFSSYSRFCFNVMLMKVKNICIEKMRVKGMDKGN